MEKKEFIYIGKWARHLNLCMDGDSPDDMWHLGHVKMDGMKDSSMRLCPLWEDGQCDRQKPVLRLAVNDDDLLN